MSTDEYTPTTEQVRAGYALAAVKGSDTFADAADHLDAAALEFDRFLAERDRQVGEQAAAQALRDHARWVSRTYSPLSGTSRNVIVDDLRAAAHRADSAAPARPTTDAEDPCATCGKPRREHRPGYSAHRCTFTARPTTDDPEGDGSWWGSEDCFERECEDFGDPEPGETRLNPETDWPCSHVVWVPARVEQWIREAALASRPTTPTPTVSEWRVLLADEARERGGSTPPYTYCERDEARARLLLARPEYVALERREVSAWTTVTTDGGEERGRHPLMAAEGDPTCDVRAGRYTCALPPGHKGAHLGVESTTDGGEG